MIVDGKRYRPERTKEEAKHFGSDLNKFIHYHCSDKMDTINLDCVQYKARYGCFRIIESKHSKEQLTPSEQRILGIFARCMTIKHYGKELPVEMFVVYGDAPYRSQVIVVDYKSKQKYIINTKKLSDRRKFEKWLGFQMSTKKFLSGENVCQSI